MSHVDLFETVRLKTLWYDLHGLLKPAERRSTKRPKRKQAFSTTIAGLALAFAATAAEASIGPTQASLSWPAGAQRVAANQLLKESLKRMRQLGRGWDGRDAPAPVERSISIAEWILPQLPTVLDARAGLDEDGNVFLRLCEGDRMAYVTVEPKSMSLLYMGSGQPNIYIDEAAFNGKALPTSIKKVLEEKFKS